MGVFNIIFFYENRMKYFFFTPKIFLLFFLNQKIQNIFFSLYLKFHNDSMDQLFCIHIKFKMYTKPSIPSIKIKLYAYNFFFQYLQGGLSIHLY